MSEFSPIRALEELALQDPHEMFNGYMAGLHGEPEPGSDKSRGYWHGWRNGMVDSGRMTKDESQAALAAEVIRAQRAH